MSDYSILKNKIEKSCRRPEQVECWFPEKGWTHKRETYDYSNYDEIPHDCQIRKINLVQSCHKFPQGLDELNLHSLDLSTNGFGEMSKYRDVLGKLDLNYLGWGFNGTSKVAGISHMKNLSKLYLEWNNISDISDLNGLKGLPLLESVILINNPIVKKFGPFKSANRWIKGSKWEENWRELEQEFPGVKFNFEIDELSDWEEYYSVEDLLELQLATKKSIENLPPHLERIRT